MRVFPLTNQTELDAWLYIYREQIPISADPSLARSADGGR
jgi:hypothetical protein